MIFVKTRLQFMQKVNGPVQRTLLQIHICEDNDSFGDLENSFLSY